MKNFSQNQTILITKGAADQVWYKLSLGAFVVTLTLLAIVHGYTLFLSRAAMRQRAQSRDIAARLQESQDRYVSLLNRTGGDRQSGKASLHEMLSCLEHIIPADIRLEHVICHRNAQTLLKGRARSMRALNSFIRVLNKEKCFNPSRVSSVERIQEENGFIFAIEVSATTEELN